LAAIAGDNAGANKEGRMTSKADRAKARNAAYMAQHELERRRRMRVFEGIEGAKKVDPYTDGPGAYIDDVWFPRRIKVELF
jgi:hypothetical protein